MIVADTDVLIDYLGGVEPAASRVEQELRTRSFATTAITAFELLAGAAGPKQTASIDRLLAALPVLPLGEPEARAAASVRQRLERGGKRIGPADSLIAGICLARRAMLLTRNRRHFERVEGLGLATL